MTDNKKLNLRLGQELDEMNDLPILKRKILGTGEDRRLETDAEFRERFLEEIASEKEGLAKVHPAMNAKRRELAAKLLDMASDVFSNHSCNDLDPSIVDMFTVEEWDEMCREYHAWNGDPEEFYPGMGVYGMQDDCLMSLAAHWLRGKS